jgi:hypothetical protein
VERNFRHYKVQIVEKPTKNINPKTLIFLKGEIKNVEDELGN